MRAAVLTGAMAAAFLILLSACATGMAGSALPSPEEIPELEAYLARNDASVPTLVRLGVAYREANRLMDARSSLERAFALDSRDPAAVFYLGLTYEDLDLPRDAREVYGHYLTVGTRNDVRALVRRRLPLLERQEFVLAARESLAREAQLAGVQPPPRTVAVFPFLYEGGDPQLRPLSRALAEMLATDLSQTDRLTVVERSRVQLLLDEIQLSGSGLVDSTTAVRGGHLLGAERIVQGRVDGDDARLRLQAAVIGTGGVWDGRQHVEEDAQRQLFDMQKRLALALYESLGVQLTPAERERVTRRMTENVEAALAYGECLQAEDAGDFAGAVSLCARAVSLDPGFAEARERGARAEDAAAAAQISTAQLAALGMPELTASLIAPLDAIQVLLPADPARSPAAEALGNEGFGRSTLVEIILRRP